MLVGQRLGPFAVEKELGSGAMGSVYKAVYSETGQVVALKMIALGLAGNENALKRFEREAAILKQLRHPNIVRLFATGRYKGTPFFAMEFVEGESLDKVLHRKGRFTWEEVIALGKPLCAALAHAHEKGIIHRDIKPSNLMILRDGSVKLTDFGIAKDADVTALTAANCTVGTASYMSPEQCKGERNLTHKSDLYSTGVVFYELLTGRKPFEAESPIQMFKQHVEGTFVRPSRLVLDIPIWLDTLVVQLLEKKPEHRPLDAAMVGKALEEVEEKVAGQQSAGVDAVKARVVDRPVQNFVPDETDREAARHLRRAAGRKPVKKKVRPFYQKAWFSALGVLLLLGVVAGAVWLMTRPPTADELYARAEKLIAAEDTYPQALARLDYKDGPVREFLKRYPTDPRRGQVEEWEELAESHRPYQRLQKQFRDARGKDAEPKFKSEAEEIAFHAVRCEEFGDAPLAYRTWAEVKKAAEGSDENRPTWWVARRRLKELDRFKTPDEAARLALVKKKFEEADQAEEKGQKSRARAIYEDVIELYRREQSKELIALVETAREKRKKL